MAGCWWRPASHGAGCALAQRARYVDIDGPLLARDRPDGLTYRDSQVFLPTLRSGAKAGQTVLILGTVVVPELWPVCG